jgi:Reverse transcriptase (RNA-dependent DNA polymerase)
MQALCKLALEPIAETRADLNSYRIRAERSTADAIEPCFTVLSRRTSAQWILEGDIRGCFDNFSHFCSVDHEPMDNALRAAPFAWLLRQPRPPNEGGASRRATANLTYSTYDLDGVA